MDQKTFWREKTQPKTKSYITWGILGGVFLCINSLLSMAVFGALGLIDVAIMGGLTLGVYLKQSRACATIMLLLFVLLEAANAYMIPIDFFSLILIVVVGYALVCGMLGTFAFQKAWQAYRDKKALPPEQ